MKNETIDRIKDANVSFMPTLEEKAEKSRE